MFFLCVRLLSLDKERRSGLQSWLKERVSVETLSRALPSFVLCVVLPNRLQESLLRFLPSQRATICLVRRLTRLAQFRREESRLRFPDQTTLRPTLRPTLRFLRQALSCPTLRLLVLLQALLLLLVLLRPKKFSPWFRLSLLHKRSRLLARKDWDAAAVVASVED